MSYGTDVTTFPGSSRPIVDKMFKGRAKPTDLPVQQPTNLQLVINIETDQTLVLTIPPAILASADEVIE